MAYAIVASKWLEDKRYIEAVLDSASDLAALGDGYAPDSRAIVAEGGAAYMTDASGQWQELGSPGGGGGPSVTVEPLTVTENGTTTAPSGKAWSPVTTNVPNSYGASDEGKVVSNGALVAQMAHADVTENGTIDTTLYNSVPINVQGNPNYVETISGTLGNPWGNADRAWLKSAVSGNEASAMMIVDGTAIGMQSITVLMSPTGSPSVLWFSASNYYEQFQTICFGWNTDSGALTTAAALANGTTMDLSSYATVVPTTLTIIHHPLPDSE